MGRLSILPEIQVSPIFHHERPISNLPATPLRYPTNQWTPDRKCIRGHIIPRALQGDPSRRDWHSSKAKGNVPTNTPAMHRPKQASSTHIFSYVLIHTHMQASHDESKEIEQVSYLTDDNGKCFHQIRVLMVPNLQKWWNIEEKFLWPNRDSNHGTLKWESDHLWPTPSEPL